MLHLLKYQFLQTIRSRSIMFWALAFPLILGTLFYVSFGNTGSCCHRHSGKQFRKCSIFPEISE